MTLRRGDLRLTDGSRMDWLRIGNGPLPVVVVPGAADGLWTVRQTALLLAWRHRHRFRTHRLLILGRREPMPSGFGVERLADDYLHAVERLRWGASTWECTSAGGPIGQWAAARRPDLVRGLILVSTMSRPNQTLLEVLETWRNLTHARRWTDLYWSMIELNRRPSALARFTPLRPLVRMIPRPRNPQRFVRLLDGLVSVDTRPILPAIACPTLVIGGEADRIVSAELQRELASLIPNSRLVLYKGYGHAASVEHPDYERATRSFVRMLRI